MSKYKQSITGIPNDFDVRTIDENSLPSAAGETAYWHCDPCEEWQHATIAAESIQCPTCGTCADLTNKDKLPLLSFESRLNRIQELCAEGSDWEATYSDLINNYADCITEMCQGKMPKHTKKTCFRYFDSVWREIDTLADYILIAKDAPQTDVPYAYTEETLQKRCFKDKRRHNMYNYSDSNLTASGANENGNDNRTQAELAELYSCKNGYSQPFYDEYFNFDDCCSGLGITDDLDKAIVAKLYEGYKRKDICRELGLSTQNLRTRIKHIKATAKENMNNL